MWKKGWSNLRGYIASGNNYKLFQKETSFCHKQHALTSGSANSQFTVACQRERLAYGRSEINVVENARRMQVRKNAVTHTGVTRNCSHHGIRDSAAAVSRSAHASNSILVYTAYRSRNGASPLERLRTH